MTTIVPGATYVHSNPELLGGQDLCVAGACAGADATTQWLTVLWIGAWMILFVLAISYLPTAQKLCERERSRTAAERDAFDRFARRVARIDTAHPVAAKVPAGMDTVVSTNGEGAGLRDVRRAYRETVMDVPHYDDEYGERLALNMAAEFDDEVATAVAGGSGSGLTPRLKRLITGHADEARERRDRFVDELDREGDELAEANSRLREWKSETDMLCRTAPSERSYGGLEATWRRLGSIATECEQLLTDRQEAITDGNKPPGISRLPLQEYLYHRLPVDYPVLAAGTELLSQIETTRTRTVDELSTRV